ncbi:chromate efflux transporter [Asticcacaulis taihuensis]|uniref:chromate efflux transporter n=1 Tax=Asticcacaulis taihuensis TaxID=260084 RepID=UPI0026ED330D|nr:chromate efflux transporter [Asticcacaulis taihuensis]
MTPAPAKTATAGGALEVLLAFLWLGLTSFGGPIAHLGYFRRAFVQKRNWLNEDEYADLVALCQFLPGPASSQTGLLIGLHRAGAWGALAAWTGFTLPSALLMFACSVLAPGLKGPVALSAIHGLKLVAVAVVAQAVWSMAGRLCPDRRRAAIALAAFLIILLVASPVTQLLAIAGGGLLGLLLCRNIPDMSAGVAHPPVRRGIGIAAGAVFIGILVALSLASALYPGHSPWALANIFYKSGTLVFGGGHVVLPLLRDALVPAGWISDDAFLAGYGAAQAIPGPLFTFAAYLGGAVASPWSPALMAALALVMLFLPGVLLVVAIYPFWSRLGHNLVARGALAGVNAAVVGVLGAALYNPVWTSAIFGPGDVAIALAGFLLLEKWHTPPLLVVGLCIGASMLRMYLGF